MWGSLDLEHSPRIPPGRAPAGGTGSPGVNSQLLSLLIFFEFLVQMCGLTLSQAEVGLKYPPSISIQAGMGFLGFHGCGGWWALYIVLNSWCLTWSTGCLGVWCLSASCWPGIPPAIWCNQPKTEKPPFPRPPHTPPTADNQQSPARSSGGAIRCQVSGVRCQVHLETLLCGLFPSRAEPVAVPSPVICYDAPAHLIISKYITVFFVSFKNISLLLHCDDKTQHHHPCPPAPPLPSSTLWKPPLGTPDSLPPPQS